jgi:protein TonB
MVRAIDSYAWRNAMFLERVRPGLAISVILHAVLFLGLAYYLAFPPGPKLIVDKPEGVITVIDPPRAPPPAKPPVEPLFKPTVTPGIEDVHTNVKPLVIPPVIDFDRGQATSAATDALPAPLIVNPRPINRGGLVYPDRALDEGRTGYVDFNFTIETDGSVGDLRMIAETPSGYGFAAAAEKAFAKWRFEPKLMDGKPVAAPARYRVSFQLK